MTAEDHIKRARALLASPDPGVVPYAALELRMAMEAITYDKLRAYAPRLPLTVLDTWQPPQAMKALLQFEPRAGSNIRVRFAEELDDKGALGPWVNLGEHRSFDSDWLRKAYNSLGSVLHIPTPRQAAKHVTELNRREAARERVERFLPELDRVASSQLTSTMATLGEFTCHACGEQVLFNEAGARQSGRAICLAEKCGAEHQLTFEGADGFTALLIATPFECRNCEHPNPVQNRHLEIGFEFTCQKCGADHRMVTKQWSYALKAELDAVQLTDPPAGA